MSQPKPIIKKVEGVWIPIHPGRGLYSIPNLMRLAYQFCVHLNIGEK